MEELVVAAAALAANPTIASTSDAATAAEVVVSQTSAVASLDGIVKQPLGALDQQALEAAARATPSTKSGQYDEMLDNYRQALTYSPPTNERLRFLGGKCMPYRSSSSSSKICSLRSTQPARQINSSRWPPPPLLQPPHNACSRQFSVCALKDGEQRATRASLNFAGGQNVDPAFRYSMPQQLGGAMGLQAARSTVGSQLYGATPVGADLLHSVSASNAAATSAAVTAATAQARQHAANTIGGGGAAPAVSSAQAIAALSSNPEFAASLQQALNVMIGVDPGLWQYNPSQQILGLDAQTAMAQSALALLGPNALAAANLASGAQKVGGELAN